MAELIYTCPTIKDTLMCAFDGDVYTITSTELVKYSTKTNEKSIIKNYNGHQEPLFIGATNKSLYAIFNNYCDIYNNKTVKTIPFSCLSATAFSINVNKLLFVTNTNIFIMKCETNEVCKYPFTHTVRINCLVELNERYIILGDVTGRMRIYDCFEQQEILIQKLHNDSIQDIALAEDYLLTVSRDKKILKVKIITIPDISIKIIDNICEFDHFINCVLVSSLVFIGLSSGELIIFNQNNFSQLYKWNLHTDSIRRICLIQKKLIATISDDRALTLSEIKIENDKLNIKLHNKNIIRKYPKIKCAHLHNDCLYIGVSDGMLFNINLTNYKRFTISKTQDIRVLCVIGNMGVVIGYESGSIHYVKNDGTKQKLKRGSTSYSMVYDSGLQVLLIGRRDGTIEKYLYTDNIFSFIDKQRLHRSIVGDIKIIDGKIYSCSDDQSILIHDMSFNRMDLIKPASDCTALNNLLIKNNVVFVSSDNGNIYVVDEGTGNQNRKLSNYPIRAAEWFADDLILGDRSGALIRLDKNLRHSFIYQGNSRVINVLDYRGKLFVVFEDAITSFERSDIEMMSNGTVFIIHGHDDALKTSVQLLLTRAEINCIVLHERPDRGRTIIDKLIEESDACKFAIALLTGDDLTADGKHHARQNVYLEVGYFIGKLGKKNVLMLKGEKVEIPSDLQGVLYTPVRDQYDTEWKGKVLKELSEAGFSIELKQILEVF